MTKKIFCDRCGEQIEESKDKSVCDNSFYMRFGDREFNMTDFCDICLCELEILYRGFMKKDNNKEYSKSIRKLKQECHQWKETCEILSNPEIMKSIKQSLIEFAEGKGIKLKDFLEETNKIKIVKE